MVDNKRHLQTSIVWAFFAILLIPSQNALRSAYSPTLSSTPTIEVEKMKISFVAEKQNDRILYTIDADGSGIYELLRGSGTIYTWSPDGRRIALERRNSHQDNELIVIDGDGSNQHVLFTLSQTEIEGVGGINSIKWSQDNQHLVFSLSRWSNGQDSAIDTEIYLINLDGLKLQMLKKSMRPNYVEYPTWLSDGQHVRYIKGIGGCNGLYIMDVNRKDEQFVFGCTEVGQNDNMFTAVTYEDIPLHAGVNAFNETNGSLAYISWTYDSRYIAFNLDTGQGLTGIRVMNMSSHDIYTLTDSGFNPVWSPNGKFIAFFDSKDKEHSVCIIKISDKTQHCGEGVDIRQGSPSWSPNSERIIFVGKVDSKPQIYDITINDSDPKPITDLTVDTLYQPQWQP